MMVGVYNRHWRSGIDHGSYNSPLKAEPLHRFVGRLITVTPTSKCANFQHQPSSTTSSYSSLRPILQQDLPFSNRHLTTALCHVYVCITLDFWFVNTGTPIFTLARTHPAHLNIMTALLADEIILYIPIFLLVLGLRWKEQVSGGV